MTYSRQARRLADNAHGNGRHSGPWNPGDDIARAVYPDPKAAQLNGESAKVREARELAQPADDEPETSEDEAPEQPARVSGPAKPAKPRTGKP